MEIAKEISRITIFFTISFVLAVKRWTILQHPMVSPIGDKVVVKLQSSTYFRQHGVVTSFCRNGSRKSVWVTLDSGVEYCSRCSYLKHATSRAGRERPGKPPTENPHAGSLVDEDQKPPATQRDDVSNMTMGDQSAKSKSSKAYAQKLAYTYDYMEKMKKHYGQDDELAGHLKHIEKLIMGLHLE